MDSNEGKTVKEIEKFSQIMDTNLIIQLNQRLIHWDGVFDPNLEFKC